MYLVIARGVSCVVIVCVTVVVIVTKMPRISADMRVVLSRIDSRARPGLG